MTQIQEIQQWKTELSQAGWLCFERLLLTDTFCLGVRAHRKSAPFPSFSITFNSFPLFRISDEQYGIIWHDTNYTHEAYSSAMMRFGPTLKVLNSEFIQFATKDGWFKNQCLESINHYVIATTSRVVEVLSNIEPKIKRVADLESADVNPEMFRKCC